MKNAFKNNFKLLKYLWDFTPSLIIWKIALMLSNVFINVIFNVIFIQYLVESMERATDFKHVILVILFIAILMLISSILDSFFERYVEPIAKKKIHKGMHSIIFNKVVQIDLEQYDNADFYNDYIWALNEIDNKTIKSFYILIDFVKALLTAFSMMVIATTLDRFMLIFVIIPIMSSVISSTLINKVNYKYSEESNSINRKKSYSKRVFYLQQYAKELRTSKIKKLIFNNFNDSVEKDVTIWKKYWKKLMGLSIIQKNSQTLFGFILMSIYLSFRIIVQKAFAASTFIALFNAVNNLIHSISSMFSVVPKIYQNGLYAEKIFNIIDYNSNIEVDSGEKAGDFKYIEFKNVDFKYPKSKDNVLNNINFSIHKGEKVAFVGINGVGKTTLVNLIMGLYKVKSGEILYNGKTIDQLNIYDYRDKFATIFQDFQIYALTLGENILMKKTTSESDEIISEVLSESYLPELKDKIHRNLTKEFDNDGLILSGGQKQKVAIARALIKKSKIIIMDEPSSSLDPISENSIMNTIISNYNNETIILISHRLSNIKNVDRIYFLHNGSITEEGSHEQLMQKKGRYYKMYNIQAQKYSEGDKYNEE